MSSYTINSIGSNSFSYPTTLVAGDILTFNITNTTESTKYLGYMIPYTFPKGCTVKIECYGARGGYGNLYTYGLTETTRSGNGAYLAANFSFAAGDQLLIAVGQAGSDAMTGTSSTRDQATGAGGGATTIAMKVASSAYLFNGISNNGSNAYAGWYVTPLMIAAGGNGSRDNGYSGTGTIYNGLATYNSAQALGYTSSGNRAGGAFSLEAGSSSASSSSYDYGRSFLNGAMGSMYSYQRTTRSYAGFGGGGANRDDGQGGGGGGWVSGYTSGAAQSYIDTSLASIVATSDGSNAAEGLVRITVLSVVQEYPTLYVANSTGKYVSTNQFYGYLDSTNKFKRVKELWTKNSSGVWVKMK